jgi:hypothetical protein
MALRNAKAFWSGYKIVTSLPAPLIGFWASALFRGLHNWRDAVQAIVISLLCFLAAVGLTFIVSLFRAPMLNGAPIFALRMRKYPNVQQKWRALTSPFCEHPAHL